ncbi:MAG: DUF3300 domain-containing protein [Deltaproteobacteria bacterium]|nr:DUF3300 domain-containing protein [Deltaproteobacteria bacterium]
MASTYPLEVVQAERWAKQNKDLKGDALTTALEKQHWDPSVKSLVNFPQVLSMMNEKLDWTQKLGDAFLAQQKEVMDTVQKLRKKAHDAGNLKTTKEQKVIVEKETIIIQPASPQVVYVAAYNPVVVYGAWPYPAYPPYYYYPPGYAATTAAFSFTAGVAVGAAWGYAWGNCNWGHNDVDIDINRNTNINQNIDRSKYQQQYQAKGQTPGQGGTGTWQHDPDHRKGVSYRDQGTAQKYNRGGSSEATKSRESFRGRSETGKQDLSRSSGDRASGRSGDRGSAGRDGRDNAFGGIDRGSQAGSESTRGRQSLEGTGSGGGSRGGGFHRK